MEKLSLTEYKQKCVNKIRASRHVLQIKVGVVFMNDKTYLRTSNQFGCGVAHQGAAQITQGRVRCSSLRERRSSLGCGVSSLRVWRSSQGCGIAHLVVRRLADRQARVRFSGRHPMEVPLLLSEEAMRIQEDRPRRMVKDE